MVFHTKDGWVVMKNRNALAYRNTSLLRRGPFVLSTDLVEDVPTEERSYCARHRPTRMHKKRPNKECRFLQVLVQDQIL